MARVPHMGLLPEVRAVWLEVRLGTLSLNCQQVSELNLKCRTAGPREHGCHSAGQDCPPTVLPAAHNHGDNLQASVMSPIAGDMILSLLNKENSSFFENLQTLAFCW